MQRICLLIVAFMLFVGCNTVPQVGTVVYINPHGWGPSEKIGVEYENEDTISYRDISLLVRYDNSFCHERIPLIINVSAPDSTYFEEQFIAQCESATDSKSGYAEIFVPYRYAVKLNQLGRYVFSITPFVDEIKGVSAIALGVTPSNKY